MKKKFAKILIIGFLIAMYLSVFTACDGNKYRAELYYSAQKMMNAEYLEANMTLGAYTDSVKDMSLFETRTHIIKNKNDFNFAFNEFPKEVDFSKKMVLIYFFTSSYPTSPYKLKKVTKDKNILHVDFKLDKSGSLGPDASIPQQTCVVVLEDILDISNVSFKQV